MPGRIQLVLSWVGAAAVGGVIVAGLGGAGGSTKDVVAERFILKDAQGRTRGMLTAADGARLALKDGGGADRIVLDTSADGTSSFIVHAPGGGVRLNVFTGDDGALGVDVEAGKARIRAGVAPNRSPLIEVRDKAGVVVLSEP